MPQAGLWTIASIMIAGKAVEIDSEVSSLLREAKCAVRSQFSALTGRR